MLPFHLRTEPIKVARKGNSRRTFNKIVGETMFDLGTYFHANMRDKRFTQEHARIVGYQERTEAYMRQKQIVHKHQNPLEYSGDSRRAAAVPTIRTGGNAQKATQQVEVKYPGLRVFNFRPHMVVEFTTITNREDATLGRVYDAVLQRKLDESGFQTNRRGNLQLS